MKAEYVKQFFEALAKRNVARGPIVVESENNAQLGVKELYITYYFDTEKWEIIDKRKNDWETIKGEGFDDLKHYLRDHFEEIFYGLD